MTDVWSERADAFRESPTHREGPDLDLLVEWCEPGHDVKALDVATGGGHVARRLREEGCTVVTVDPAPGMEPDVVAPAEDLPFEDGSFDVVACRIAAHHFHDVRKAVAEMVRVSGRLLVIEDNVFRGEHVEEAERLRDPSHVRCYSEEEWRELVSQAGFEVEQLEHFPRRQSFDAWLERVDTPPAAAEQIRGLLAGEIDADGMLGFRSIVLKARRSQK
jgi:ubiquinone/menaquinone biosynthesis C-methylase UbiE